MGTINICCLTPVNVLIIDQYVQDDADHLKLHLLHQIQQYWIDKQVDCVCAECISACLSFDSPVIPGYFRCRMCKKHIHPLFANMTIYHE